MPGWDCLIDEGAVASVIPDEYARFRRPVREALAVFLDGLPPAHQAAVLSEQATLPPTATAAERLALLARGCPALHKLGQILARDRRLSAELRGYLQQLESLPPSVPLEAIQGILAREFRRLDRLGVTLRPPALAEASVAVVIPFRRSGGPGGTSQEGVFKLLKPGVEERLEQELGLLARVGAYLDQRCDDLHIPHLDYRDSFEQVRDKLRHELRLDLEQRHLAQARRVYADEPRVQIPALLDLCTPRVTAMEWITGGKITEHGLTAGDEKRRLADLVVEALIARPFFAPAGAALFHGDPHAGNLFRTRDGQLAVLDWSLAGSLSDRDRSGIVQIALGAVAHRADRIVTALTGLSERRRVDRPALESVVHAWLRRVRWGRLPGFTWLMGLLDDATQTARLRGGADLLLFRKALHTLTGVVADLGAGDRRVDDVLLGEFLRHLVAECPRRWLAPPHCRAFATRLSNADLARFTLGLPWTVAQVWMGQTLDMVSGQAP